VALRAPEGRSFTVTFGTAVDEEVAVVGNDEKAEEVDEARVLLFDDCARAAWVVAATAIRPLRKEVRMLVSGILLR
jgi:hypothetical protein